VEVEASTIVEGDAQFVDVNVSDNYFDPNIITAQAGVPITMNLGEGQGCMAEFSFPAFNVFEDLTDGGAVVELPALDPGAYEFSCGMEMVFGTLVVQ
jgi:plastocyanin domain-containing protein